MQSLQSMMVFGVAGNFAGHLEQAGEAADFASVQVAESHAPKAMFPVYLPAPHDSFLATFPLTHNGILYPQDSSDQLQIEPEIGLYVEITYDSQGAISALKPQAFAAYNDCSIRRPNAHKIADKKNWGRCSKGVSDTTIALDSFSKAGNIDHYRIACFHHRDGQCHAYGIDSAVADYSYNYQKLLDWMVTRLNTQPDQGPMHDLASLIASSQRPTQALISIGATRYTPYGEQHFLRPGDTAVVVVYDGRLYQAQEIAQMAASLEFAEEGISALIQPIVAAFHDVAAQETKEKDAIL
ncbi:hypothetical protein VST7929_03212 [Vibrio stylophorae]|uniref:Uncharacterized protein n=1 Tax=Vibrio stylophorae TaxID=659351 RepID=A0ABM8ZY06_9VIBR|nr:DUF5718 family protein [Vibrio stylophorae]CAH0535738.1 hypothetical protein VST7929_03212 [Vibrio stylophorae]